MKFDPEKYIRFMQDIELPDTQKKELLEALWCYVVGRVDKAFGVHLAQSTGVSKRKRVAQMQNQTLDSKKSTTEKFNRLTDQR